MAWLDQDIHLSNAELLELAANHLGCPAQLAGRWQGRVGSIAHHVQRLGVPLGGRLVFA